MRNLIIGLFVILLITSCKTNNLYKQVLNPAPVTIPPFVKKVGVLKRSIPTPENKTYNTIHQIISGEGPEMIPQGSEEAIRGLKDALMANNRFEEVVLLPLPEAKGAAAGMINSPLSWEQVDSLCRHYHLDAVFALEMFDTQFKMNTLLNAVNPANPVQSLLPAQPQISMATTVKTAWRIYDPVNRMIRDEFSLWHTLTFNGSGAGSILGTTDALSGRREAVKRTAYKVGNIYADRLRSYWVTITREYYIKGNMAFKIAKRKARTGNWDGAAEIWNNETNSPKRKIAGRAFYNMAIYNEISGNLDAALDWASKSYETFGNRRALRYVNILKNRKFKDAVLQSQSPQ